jgi:hypothetical protein
MVGKTFENEMDKGDDKYPIKQCPTIGACGLDCGLCPRYYTAGKSRCPGCAGPGFIEKHPSCSFITCCVRKRHLEVCGECSDFPCSKFKSEAEYQQAKPSSSYPPEIKIMPNQHFIKKHGIKSFIALQTEQMKILALLLEKFDDGRSKSYYCRIASEADSTTTKEAMAQAAKVIEREEVAEDDYKSKARILKALLDKRLSYGD